MKDLKMVNFPCLVKNLPMRLSTANCWDAFLQTSRDVMIEIQHEINVNF